jgi:UDP-glucose 4-epimerase
MATYLVTGGAGFIGSHVCDRLLAAGERVVALDDLSTGSRANLAHARTHGKAFAFQRADIRSDDLLPVFRKHQPDVVIHLAAQAGVRPSLRDPVLDASVNVLGLVRVLEAAAASGVAKVVYAASGGTRYGRPRRLPVTETHRGGAGPESPYGISKRVGEDYLRFYRRRRGLDFTTLALGNVFGPRQDPHGEAGVVAIFGLRMLAGERPTIFGSGEQTRDYVYVDDVVEAFSLASTRGSGELLNVSSGAETSVLRIFDLLAAETGYEGEAEFGPPVGDDLPRIALDPRRAGETLAWTPTVSLREGIRRTVEWLRAAPRRHGRP